MAVFRPAHPNGSAALIFPGGGYRWVVADKEGYEMARWEHFWLTLGYVGFFVIHLAQVIRAGWNNFRAMVTGYELVEVKSDA